MQFSRIMLLFCILMCSTYAKIYAQYLGGIGVGFASATSGGIVLAYEDILELRSVPEAFKLYQNYPNPFNPTTTIQYTLSADLTYETQDVRLTVYDMLGREVDVLVSEKQNPGNYEVNFNATNLTNGVYFYKFSAGQFTDTKKLILMK